MKTSKLLLSEYAKKLDQQVKKRYVEKIAAIVIDPVLLTPEKNIGTGLLTTCGGYESSNLSRFGD